MNKTNEKMNTLPYSSKYATNDFYLAAYLKAKNLKLVSTEREGRRTTFVFEHKPDIEELILSFYNDGEVKVNAFKNAIADLKAVIFNLQFQEELDAEMNILIKLGDRKTLHPVRLILACQGF